MSLFKAMFKIDEHEAEVNDLKDQIQILKYQNLKLEEKMNEKIETILSNM